MLYEGDFIFDGTYASEFGVMLASISSSSNTISSGLQRKPSEYTSPYRRSSLLYDTPYSEKLKFSITIVKQDDKMPYFSADEVRALNSWLISPKEYKWLRLNDSDFRFNDLYYNVLFTNVNEEANGGMVYALTYSAECDSPFAWSEEKKVTLRSTSDPTTYTVYNDSDDNDNVYPYLSIVCNSATSVEIVNESDNGSIFSISAVAPDSNFSNADFDCENQVVKTNGIMLLDDFNFKFLRLLPGRNRLTLKGDFTAKLTYRCARMAGIS